MYLIEATIYWERHPTKTDHWPVTTPRSMKINSHCWHKNQHPEQLGTECATVITNDIMTYSLLGFVWCMQLTASQMNGGSAVTKWQF